ncbi:MAG: YncE family protein, partial [Myxococcota bacterium]
MCFLAAAACAESTPSDGPSDAGHDPVDGGQGPGGNPDVLVSQRTSRGSSIAVDEEHRTLAVANKATNDVTLFDLPDLVFRAHIPVGKEPVSVSFSPDGTTLYVVNRGSKSVTIIDGVDGNSWAVRRQVAVGSEPTSGALSPTGAFFYVANWADGTMSVVDTAQGTVAEVVELGGAPYAVCVSNDFDEEDGDEYIYVTDFYSQPISGQREATDGSREGRLFKIAPTAGNYQIQPIALPALRVKGIEDFI